MSNTESNDDFLCHAFPGSSPAMERFRSDIDKLNRYCHRYRGAIRCVLFTGESGVGKTYTARAISAHSQWLTLTDDERRELYYNGGQISFPSAQLIDKLLTKEHLPFRGSKPRLVPRLATVLGPQLADDLAASELFGHKKHAFTGAEQEHTGIFGDDSVDDVLLDEIAELEPRVQAKLLQVFETRTFRPVGGTAEDESKSEHRIFLATNRSLIDWVQDGRFREDLYWRIQGHQIEIPPLRERKEVIGDLMLSILASVNQEQRGDQQVGPLLPGEEVSEKYCLLPESDWVGGQTLKSTWVVQSTEDDVKWSQSYDWPGNVRELQQRLELYVYHNGHIRLRDVKPLQQLDDFRAERDPDGDVAAMVQNAVGLYLQRVLDGTESPPGKPSDLTKYFDKLITGSVYKFKIKNRLKPADLRQMFPEAKDPDTTIGRWKSASEPT